MCYVNKTKSEAQLFLILTLSLVAKILIFLYSWLNAIYILKIEKSIVDTSTTLLLLIIHLLVVTIMIMLVTRIYPIIESLLPIPSTGTIVSFQDPIPTRALMGAVVSNAYQLTDQNNQHGIFFVFQDLSVRVEGRFSLKFMFIDLSAGYIYTLFLLLL